MSLGNIYFFIFIFTQLDTIAQSWGQLPIFFLRSYLKSKIRRKIPLIPFATYSQHPVKDKMGNSKETFYKMILVTWFHWNCIQPSFIKWNITTIHSQKPSLSSGTTYIWQLQWNPIKISPNPSHQGNQGVPANIPISKRKVNLEQQQKHITWQKER